MAKLTLLSTLTAALVLASFLAHLTAAARPSTAAPGPSSGGKHPTTRLRQPSPHISLRPPHSSAEAPSPVERDGFAPPPAPSSILNPTAEICLSKLSEECGKELYRGIFRDQALSVSEKCCGQVMAVGRSCHRVLLRASISKPGLMLTEKKTIEKMDAEVWSRCAFITDEVV